MKTNDNNVKNFLKRAKLLMEYDLKKTSDENIKTLNEQDDDDDRVVQDPAMDSTKCSKWNESQAEKYYRDVSEALNIELGVPDIMFQGLKKQKTESGGSWGETNTATLDKEVELLEDYLDLSWNFGAGESFEAGKILSIFDRFADYAVLGTDENGASKWFPACEYIRMQYIVQTDGETLHTELEDPSGWTDAEEERTAKTVENKIIYCYKNWMRALQKFNGCPPYNVKPKPPVDPKPPIVDPKPGDEPWKECCVFSSSRFPGAKYRPATKDIIINVEYGFMLLKPGNAGWGSGGSLTVFDDDDKPFNQGKWTCGGGEFKFYVTG